MKILLFLAATVLLIAACQSETTQTGTLEGTVTIGPITPVERPGVTPLVPPTVFEARKIMVYNKDGTELIQKVDIAQIDQGQKGRYKVELKPGSYTVDINHSGIDSSSQVPRQVQILPGETVELNIDIDTGIR